MYFMRLGLLLSFAHILYVSAQTCEEYDEIAEDEWQRVFVDIRKGNDRFPLGFRRAIAFYDGGTRDNTLPDPCFQLNDVEDKAIEIMFETVPSSVLCFKDQFNNERCGDTQYRECIPVSPSGSMQYTFSVDVPGGSAEGDIDFWVRIRVGPIREDDTEYLWCTNEDAQYPQSLMVLPPYVTAPPVDRGDSGATAIAASASVCFAVSFFLLL